MRDFSAFCNKCGSKIAWTGIRVIRHLLLWWVGNISYIVYQNCTGVRFKKFFAYVIGAAIAIIAAVLFYKISNRSSSKALYRTALILAVVVIVSVVGIRIIYEAKLDAVIAYAPASDIVHLRLHTEEKFYSYVREGYVSDPSSMVRIGDAWYDSGDMIRVDPKKAYSIRVSCRYTGTGAYTGMGNLLMGDFPMGISAFRSTT